MQQEMERLRQSFRARGFPEIRMRIGIHTGQAIVGNMGASERFDYTAVGDAVNLASRIEGVNKLYGTGILITRDVFDELDGLLPLWPIDIIRVKGKSLPMQIYTLNNNEIVGSRIASALDCFHQRNWQAALEKWQTLAGESECRQIAEIYIERIERFLQDPPAEDWDGSFALDKM